ncbi:MAG TPA: AI-2E family transporter [Solirubrobacteraceae bacterium]|nr:AI-2E family transporter [Solirubrobacteraceae bacterium]
MPRTTTSPRLESPADRTARRSAETEPPARGADEASDGALRLRRIGERCLWLLVVGGTIYAGLWIASELRLVVLPVLLALVLATFFAPPVAWARRRGVPRAVAALGALVAALAAACAMGAIIWRGIADLDELDVSLAGGLERIERWLADGPLGLSDSQISLALDRLQDAIGDQLGALSQTAVAGAFAVLEVLGGVLLAIVLLFFFLKDGDRIFAWLTGLAPRRRRQDVHELGQRVWSALGGFLRGQTVVAAFDATFIALALVLLGVPLVMPLALLTFVGAYIPIVGATLAGAAAALVALVAEGPAIALLVVVAIVLVQQLEGNVLQPIVVGRAVDVHPVAVLLGVTAGFVLGGIIGAMVAAPILAVGAAVLRYAREGDEAGERAPDDASVGVPR